MKLNKISASLPRTIKTELVTTGDSKARVETPAGSNSEARLNFPPTPGIPKTGGKSDCQAQGKAHSGPTGEPAKTPSHLKQQTARFLKLSYRISGSFLRERERKPVNFEGVVR